MGPKYYSTTAGFAECSTGYMAVTDAFECSEAYAAITGVSRRPVEGSWPDHPVGCMTHYGATGHEVGDRNELLLNKPGVGVTDQVTYRDISQLCARTDPIEAPTQAPTDEPTSAATSAPTTDAPTETPTSAPTFRQMCDAPNGCDLHPGGHCFKTGGDGWECDCAFGWNCTDGCAKPHQPNQCSQPTEAPTTDAPTTDAPTTEAPTTDAPTEALLVQATTTIKAPTDDETTAAIGFNTVLKMDATPCFYSGQCSSISLAEIAQLQERIKTIADTAGMEVSHVTVKNVKISALAVVSASSPC